MDGFFNAYQALDARMKLVDAVANNLANAQTTGFKRDFSRILQTETGFEVASQVDLSPGELISRQTARTLRVKAFFKTCSRPATLKPRRPNPTEPIIPCRRMTATTGWGVRSRASPTRANRSLISSMNSIALR